MRAMFSNAEYASKVIYSIGMVHMLNVLIEDTVREDATDLMLNHYNSQREYYMSYAEGAFKKDLDSLHSYC